MLREFVLSDGSKIPSIALGTSGITEDNDTEHVIENALLNGYRHLDMAYIYGNEGYVGKAIKQAISRSSGTLKRKDIYITSKLYCCHFSPKTALAMIDKQLAECQLDYFDLYLMHWPTPFEEGGDDIPLDEKGFVKPGKTDIVTTWKAMEQIKATGKVKSIGVSNFNEKQLQRILDSCEDPPVVNQTEVHPYLPCNELHEFCKKHNILMTAYGVLGAGAGTRSWGKPTDPVLLNDPVIQSIASRLNTTSAKVLIRWLLQRNILAITRSSKLQRLKDVLTVYDMSLSENDMQEISSIKRRFRYYLIPFMIKHPEYPYEIWDQ